MADTITSQTIINGARNLVMKFTNESDGTGESAVTKVDATSSTFGTPGVHLKIKRITYAVKNGAVRLLWDANSDTDIVILSGYGKMEHKYFLPNPNAAGATGSILFTTVDFIPGSSYTVTLDMIKGVVVP